MTKKQNITLDIEGISEKGSGVGFHQAEEERPVRRFEVAFTAPGDKVLLTNLHKRKGKWTGKLEAIEEMSPLRVEPTCIHFADCGGCKWQHISYGEQLNIKQKKINDHFKEVISSQTTIFPIIGSSEEWRYRNKMDFSFSQKKGLYRLGLFANAGKGNIVNLQECHLVAPWFMEAAEATRSWWKEHTLEAYFPPKDRGSLRTLTLRHGQRTGDRMVILNVSGNPDYGLSKNHLESFVAYIRDGVESDQNLSIFLRIQQAVKGMTTNFYEMLLYGPDYLRETLSIAVGPAHEATNFEFSVGPSSFFQPNTFQAEQIYSRALQMAKPTKEDVVYDLYCGTGTLGICIAPLVKEVLGIELSPEAALDAKTNVANNGLTNVTILSGAVRHALKQVREEGKFSPPDIVMIDPPRPGLDPEAMEQLISLKAPRIIYISCNPKTQAEDIKTLLSMGYRLTKLQAVDQFPHTYHVENIALLEK